MLSNIKCGKYDNCNGQEWTLILDAGKNLIRSILNVNPSQRITLDEAMCHPWFHDHDIAIDDNTSLTLAEELLQQHSFQLSHPSSSARSRSGSVCSASPIQNARKSISRRSSTISDNVVTGRSSLTLTAWLKANHFEDFEDRVRKLATTMEELKNVTDEDFDRFCQNVRVPKLRARRFRRALNKLGAPISNTSSISK